MCGCVCVVVCVCARACVYLCVCVCGEEGGGAVVEGDGPVQDVLLPGFGRL